MISLLILAIIVILISTAGFVATFGEPESLFFFVFAFAIILLYYKNIRLGQRFEDQISSLDAIYRAIPDILFCKDTNCVYTRCNKSFKNIMNLAESEIIGRTPSELFHFNAEEIEKIIESDRRVMHENTMLTTREWLVWPDGSRRFMEVVKVPLRRKGIVTGILGMARDLTEHSAAEESAREATKVKSAFLAHMSHEIRTPLNAIVGMTELLLQDTLTKQSRENALILKQSGSNLLSIVNDILDFSKIEAGKLIIVPERYSFSSLIHDVVNIIRMRVKTKSITFTVNVDCNIPGTLIGDAIRIRQILLNILSNAVKYTNEGFISLVIACDMQDDLAILTATVSDSGVGIKEELLGKLFEDFVQIDPEKNKKIEGTGLGLAITKSLCSAMGGEVTVSSVYGKGSIFTVVLPQQFTASGKFACVERLEQKHVLVYEPRSRYAESIAASLDNLGVDGAIVSSRSDFFAELQKKPYAFVFAPYFMLEIVEFAFDELGLAPKLILMTEFGESVSSDKIRTITTPLYTLPIANILNNVDGGTYSRDEEAGSPFIAPSAKILIVDDFNTNLKVVEGLLSRYKVQIDTSSRGMDALAMARKNFYDMIFMDHMMPGMDGLETTAQIRALEDGSGYYTNLPIIALTANVVSGMKDIFLKNGLNDIQAKPVEPSKLYTILEKWLPKNKIQYIAIEEDDASISNWIEIEGIEMATGMSLNGGNFEQYIGTLAIFYKEGMEKIDEVRDCLKYDNIRQYTTHVHALKSALLSIGAIRLSDFARTLEIAGENKATDFLMENTVSFLLELETLLYHINHALVENQSQSEDNDTNDLVFFKAELDKLKMSLQHMDAGEINSTLALLTSSIKGKKSRETIKRLAQLILEFEYEMAINLIDGLL